MRRVAVVDAQWGGHIEAYHQLVVQGLLEQGHAVLSLSPHPNRVAEWISSSCPEATRRAAFRTFERQLAPRSAGEPRSRPGRQIATRAIGAVPGVRSTWHLRRAVAQWRRVASAVRQVATKPPDLVFLPYLDGGFLHPMLTVGIVDRLCPMQWTGVYFHPTDLRTSKGRRSAAARSRIMRSSYCRMVAVLDEGITDRLRVRLGKPVLHFPDVANLEYCGATPLADQIRELAAGRPVIALVGGLGRKKNVGAFLDLAYHLDPNRYVFVLAGELLEPTFSSRELARIKAMLKHPPPNIIAHLETIPDGTAYNAIIAASTIVVAAYSDAFHSSNTLTKTAAFRKPVIVADGYLMAERVRQYDLGAVVPVVDSAHLASAVEALSAKSPERDGLRAPRVDRYRAIHSIAALNRVLSSMMHTIEGGNGSPMPLLRQ